MQGNNNWSIYVPESDRRARSRNNMARETPFTNQGVPRSNYGGSGSNNLRPPSYRNSGNMQSDSSLHYGNIDGPGHSRQRQQNSSRHFSARSFPGFARPSPYSRPHQANGHRSLPESNAQSNLDIDVIRESDPLDAKIGKLLDAVMSQRGFLGDLIFLQTEMDHPIVILQNAVQSINGTLQIKSSQHLYELFINRYKMASGCFPNKQDAKNVLCHMVLTELRRKCFFIIKKRNYEEVTTDDISNAKKDVPQSSTMEGSKAHQMMLKMGWGGKGLGSKEQGAQETVADTITKNISKAGLGENNVMNEVQTILEDFAKSSKVTTLAFDSGFTKEERAHIHSMAGKFNLKSKSEGKGDDRRITISKKILKWDLVKELLLVNCENDSYKLIIPPDFENLWNEQ